MAGGRERAGEEKKGRGRGTLLEEGESGRRERISEKERERERAQEEQLNKRQKGKRAQKSTNSKMHEQFSL